MYRVFSDTKKCVGALIAQQLTFCMFIITDINLLALLSHDFQSKHRNDALL